MKKGKGRGEGARSAFALGFPKQKKDLPPNHLDNSVTFLHRLIIIWACCCILYNYDLIIYVWWNTDLLILYGLIINLK